VIVRSIANSGDVLPPTSRDRTVGIDENTEFPVTIGRSYPVFAMTIYLGVAWYYILNDDGHEWPTWAPAPLFELLDGSLPASWRLGYFHFSQERQFPILSFPEWANDHTFYERLVDGDATAVRTFSERRLEIEVNESR